MYSSAIMYIMAIDILALVCFNAYNLLTGKRRLIHWLFAAMSLSLVIWQAAVIAMRLVDESDMVALFVCDAVSNIGVFFTPVTTLMLAITFTRGLDKLPKKCLYLLIVPVLGVVSVFTNPLHHLHYRVFHVRPEGIVFGPLMFAFGAYGYFCLIAAMVITMRYGIASRHKLYYRQSLMFMISILIPLVINMIATLQLFPLTIADTPLAFSATVVFQGIAVYYDFLNIKPLALERVLDSISDGYILLSAGGRVVSFNRPFSAVFSPMYDIHVGTNLKERVRRRSDGTSGIIYNLLASIDSARSSCGSISYEQAVLMEQGMNYYAVEVTPLVVGGEICGFIAMFKDVTRLRETMKREQDDLSRAMERERLASLGQMIGGIAHNLKTPIMAISGGVGVLTKLADEYRDSVGDAEVTEEDHREIHGEIVDWLSKIQACCAYMSDIITTVKGLATNMSTSVPGEFGVDELYKRVLLLMQHELSRGHCAITYENTIPAGVRINGDINNLVQVLNNLISNAIDAMRDKGGGQIVLRTEIRGQDIVISVSDQGPGVPDEVREKLFHGMYTSKGTKGTGIGLYISNALMHGKFGGRLWLEESSPGATFCLSIPLENGA